ncbi:MAG: hypothetical protein ACI9C1_000290 [Candidatus Aldehydirespiratoraceae bacterium]|jgi:hypothetical protein
MGDRMDQSDSRLGRIETDVHEVKTEMREFRMEFHSMSRAIVLSVMAMAVMLAVLVLTIGIAALAA